ncbi:16S rRNA (cytidine(1402)-2'-O)-methyltransferase [Rhodobacteraceae bacterium CCMM004]|nr:16S rRNA (cytidine(1402)-2'-O)-methyltransferase [Rhodobacteraceae bacterium CCMM004]
MSGDPAGPPVLAPGLYLVATPIGNARDITLRALDTLAAAQVLAAEDTRTLRRLLDIHGLPLSGRRPVAYHDRNGAAVRPRLLAALAEGRSVAYVSDAGTPLVADPGFPLVRAAVAAGHPVTAVPGPSAPLAALSVSGLPSDRFLFVGFLPPAAGARRRALEDLRGVQATLILFESARRSARTLEEIGATLGYDRQAAMARELTKRFEEVRRGTVADLIASCAADPPRGEVVLLVDRPGSGAGDPADLTAALETAMADASVKDAAREVAEALGLPRREVYAAALALRAKDGTPD